MIKERSDIFIMSTRSEVTRELYNEEEMVFFRNPTQSAYYCLKGAKLVDVFATNELKFVFVFSKEDHRKIKKDWEKRKQIVKENA